MVRMLSQLLVDSLPNFLIFPDWGVASGGQSGAAVRRSHWNHQDMDSNPAAPRNEKTDIGQNPLHRRCPNSLAGSQWKTGDVKPN